MDRQHDERDFPEIGEVHPSEDSEPGAPKRRRPEHDALARSEVRKTTATTQHSFDGASFGTDDTFNAHVDEAMP